MKPHTIKLLCATALLTGGQAAVAQESLMDIYQRALQNDPAIREAEARFLASSEVRPQARSQLLPSFQFRASTSTNASTDPNPATEPVTGEVLGTVSSTERESDSESWNVSLSQTVFDWGRILTLKQADKQVAQAETEFEIARLDLLLRVAETYFNVLASEDSLEAQVAARQALETQLEQAQRRFEVGLIAITDVQETRSGFDSAVAAEIEAQRVLATAQEQLREMIGDYVTDLSGPDGDLPLVTPDPENPDEWVEVALEQNLELVAARIAANIANDDIAIARSVRFPTLSFSSSYQDSTNESRRTVNYFTRATERFPSISGSEGYQWSLNLDVPIFSGGANSSRIRQSVYQHRATLEATERVARQTERLTRDSYLGVVSTISQVQALDQAVESAETALRATQAGFEVGTRTSVELVASQESLLRAQTNYARARYDYIINTLRLKQAAGTLSVSDVEQVDGWLE